MKIRKLLLILLTLATLFLSACGCGKPKDPVTPNQPVNEPTTTVVEQPTTPVVEQQTIDEDGTFDSKDEVALYIYTYQKLPSNYITKKEARSLGWSGGSLEKYAPGKCIGGDVFRNYEGNLPEGHSYIECDIDTLGKKSRGAKRIVFDTDGNIYYTDDHYETFEQLYGGE